MKFRFRIVLSVFAVLLSACNVQPQNEYPFFDDFLKAVEARDSETLSTFMLDPEQFFPGGVMDEETTRFTYDGEALRGYRSDLKSLSEFLAEPYQIFPDSYQVEEAGYLPEERVIFIVVPDAHVADMDSAEFYNEEWMVSYFACEFYRTESGYKMLNFCFSETGGPYHDYG